MGLNETLGIMVSHRETCDETANALGRLGSMPFIKVKGDACIDRARSIAFDRAYEVATRLPLRAILCIDDDMVFNAHQALSLVNEALAEKYPVSGRYAKHNGDLAHKTVNGGKTWFGGLGFLAIPVEPFISLGDRLPTIGQYRAWCRTGELFPEFPGEWKGEDDWFCSHFQRDGQRGIKLSSDIIVGHVKPTVVYPR